jgi:predicted esterase
MAAAAIPDVVAAAVLRPGYSDGTDRSDGMRGETTGDNYTPEVIDAVATAIGQLTARYHPRRTILVGHSGGSAIAADLLGSKGAVADAALLVSCPCDLAAWRKHMQSVKGGAIWDRPVRSLSPIAVVDRIPAPVRMSLLVGGDDPVTPPALTQAYAEALRNHGAKIDLTVAPGLTHNILLEPVTIERLKDLVGAVDGDH